MVPEPELPLVEPSAFDALLGWVIHQAGRVLCDPDAKMWGIDHGLRFAAPV